MKRKSELRKFSLDNYPSSVSNPVTFLSSFLFILQVSFFILVFSLLSHDDFFPSMSNESPSKDSDPDDIITGQQIFYRKIEGEMKAKDPKVMFADVAAKVDQEWRNLSKEEKKVFKDEASQRNNRLLEKETRRIPVDESDVVTIDDSEEEDAQERQGEDLVWEDDETSTCSRKKSVKKIPVLQIKRCIRLGCPNSVKPDPDWDEEFCSEKCVVSHVKKVFNSWKGNRISSSNSS